jgi:hypothetical protein
MGMGKASRTKQQPDRRARVAAQREAERRREQRRRIYLAGGSVLVVAIIVGAFFIFKSSGSASAASNGPAGTALAKVTSQVTGVPTTVTDKVAGGSITTKQFIPGSGMAAATSAGGSGGYFATVNGKALTSGGKPEVFYLGAEYCPYCAAERWSMINALSRFGTFTGLTTKHSSSTDVDPNTPTWTFYGSTYTSKYVTFTPVEETTNIADGKGGYTTLQTPTAAQTLIGETYDASGSIPFIDLGNKYVEVGNLQPYGPDLLKGKSWAQIATALSQPTSSIAQGAIGSANYLTAGICAQTGNLPATACTPTIKGLESTFASSAT